MISIGDLDSLAAWHDAIEEGFCALDQNWRIIAVNDTALALVGFSREAAYDRILWEVIPGSAETEYGAFLRRAMAQAQRLNFEVESRLDPGRFYRAVVLPLAADVGIAVAFYETTRERALERKRAREVRENEIRLRLALEATRTGIWDVDIPTSTMTLDERCRELLGIRAEERLTYEVFLSLLHPADRTAAVEGIERGLDPHGTGEIRAEYRILMLETWEDRWVAVQGKVYFEAGQPVRITGTLRDITPRKQTEEALKARERQLMEALQAASMAAFEYDNRRNRLTKGPRLNEIYGFPSDHEITLSDMQGRCHPADIERFCEIFAPESAEPAQNFEVEFRLLLPGNTIRWMSSRGEYVRDPQSRLVKTRGIVMDVTDRKHVEERQILLMHELNHRVKNTLATVQSVVNRTLRGDARTDAMRRDIEQRLLALSRAHDVLTRENWESASLNSLVAEALRPYRESADRLTAKGPELRLPPQDVLGLSMALHELATNAAKYGALSVPGGSVAITWTIEAGPQPKLVLCWREQNGPPPTPPQRQGFGTRLIERSLAHVEGAKVTLRYPREGAICQFELPLRSASPNPNTRMS
ncbi:HWE histidine kinase domain-containing protein [Microvirga massiliensis]|uniref:HWE histidine kinase domain-containing protein n=1 Tax=Microvirga massiliensis TaxID=1033741 RepID=UPI00062BB162|nr:HWE histidine kinase domain-containing protein [Microvirga massiliensis]